MRVLKKLLMLSVVLLFGTMPSWAGQVTIAPAENGSVTANPASPEAGATVTLTVSPATGYTLDAISAELTIDPGSAQLPRRAEGPHVGIPVELTTVVEGTTYTFVMPEAPYSVAVTATFKEADYTVTVADGIENGTVTADPTTAHYGDEVYVTATPAEGYELETLTYTVEGENPVAIENGVFNMPAANVTINATFKKTLYTITVNSGPNGLVDVPQGANMGDEVIVTVVPDPGYEIDELTYSYDIIEVEGSQLPYPFHYEFYIENGKFTMPAANVTINASFKKVDYTITVAATENGTVEAPATAQFGDEVTVTATPAEGYVLNSLTYTPEGGEPVAIENGTFSMPAANVTINATFSEIEYFYSVVEEVKCIVTADPDPVVGFAVEGQTLTMRIVPNSGTKVKEVVVNKVSGDGPNKVEEPIDCSVTEVDDVTRLSFTMPASEVEIHVICADLYAITLDDGDDSQNYALIDKTEAIEGETVTVTTQIASGYMVDEIYYVYNLDGFDVEGELEQGNGTYTFTMPASPVTVVVTFKTILDYYQLKFDAETAEGSLSVYADYIPINSMDMVAEFSNIAVSVSPAEGYEIDTFMVVEGLYSVGDDLENTHEVSYTLEDDLYHFSMPRSNASILVTYKPATYTITVGAIENGTVEADKQTATLGELVTLTVTPDEGYDLSSLTVTYDEGFVFVVDGNAPRRVEQNVEVTKVDDTTYTFNMPAGDVNVNATFSETIITAISDINATQDGKAVRYFDLQGRYIGTSLEGASNGIYVTNDGRKVVK